MTQGPPIDKPKTARGRNGCYTCPEPHLKSWTNNLKLQERHRKAGITFFFKNGYGLIELCAAHWAEVRCYLTGEAEPLSKEERAARIAGALAFLEEHAHRPPAPITLEVFA